jgi:lipoate-protein ligase B
MSTPTVIRHVHLPGITPFAYAQALQQHLVSQFLTHKAAISAINPPHPLPAAPLPTIITFTPKPVYTTGRREHDTLSPSQRELLTAPMIPLRPPSRPRALPYVPEIVPTLRGGQTTFHGPGQLVVYPILDLKTQFPLFPKGISVRCYVHLLEQTTINWLTWWQVVGIRTENPGVWDESGERKIAALGVHLRRNITSYGVGLNINTDLRWFERIVACGLVGKGVTNVEELRKEKGIEMKKKQMGRVYKHTGFHWANGFAKGLYGEDGGWMVKKFRVEELGFEEEDLERILKLRESPEVEVV